jgi:hypothetical protein
MTGVFTNEAGQKLPSVIGVGRLGATATEGMSTTALLCEALGMAERRILRLEMALRRAGIEVEMTELPT